MSNTLMGKIYIVIQKSLAGLLKLENTDCKGCLVFRDPSVSKLSLRYNKRTELQTTKKNFDYAKIITPPEYGQDRRN